MAILSDGSLGSQLVDCLLERVAFFGGTNEFSVVELEFELPSTELVDLQVGMST